MEVLRGPQGTLYGSGSTGGTIRFIPKRPEFDGYTVDASTKFSLTEASDELNYAFDGVVNIPVIDNRLAVRVAAGYEQLGGFVDANGFVATDSTDNGPLFPGNPIPSVPGDLTSGFVLDPRKKILTITIIGTCEHQHFGRRQKVLKYFFLTIIRRAPRMIYKVSTPDSMVAFAITVPCATLGLSTTMY